MLVKSDTKLKNNDISIWNIIFSWQRTGDQQCLLGETRIIERRKPSVCCWNSRQYERLISTTPCECTAADFEWSVVTYIQLCHVYLTTRNCVCAYNN